MGLDLGFVDGQTPLEEEEKEGLLISTVTTRGELDEFEQYNIEKAIQWTVTHRFNKEEILTETFIRKVHKKMYEEVWAWAGEFQKDQQEPWRRPKPDTYSVKVTA